MTAIKAGDEGASPAFIAAVLAVACPACGAGQGEKCISRTGLTRYPAGDPHTARAEAAKRLARLERQD